MIAIVYGTTGELIKLAPVVEALGERGHRPLLLCTGQQVQQIPIFQRELGLADVDVWLARGSGECDLDRKREIPGWVARVAWSVIRRQRALRARLASDGKPPFVLVHGDTFTTVLGTLIGHALRAEVAHIEAGLRSGDWRNPFPEELNRRITARLADVHFAPGAGAVANLRREHVRGEILDTGHNTIRDAVKLVAGRTQPPVDLPDEPFGLVSLHRFELIEREAALAELLGILHEHSRRQPLLFINHSTTAAVIDRHPEMRSLFDERFRRIPRLPYVAFIALLREAAFLVTDSGGSQEECAFLGMPCLVHRVVSERDDGLGTSVVLSRLELPVVREFLAAPERWRVEPDGAGASPSHCIVETLVARGVV